MVLAGCGEYHNTYKFNENGSIFATKTIKVNDAVRQVDPDVMDKAANIMKTTAKGFDIDEFNNNEYVGTRLFPNIKALVNFDTKLWSPDEWHKGIQVKKGFIYDYYSIDLSLKKEKQMNLNYNYEPEIPSYFSPDNKINSGITYYQKRRQAQNEVNQVNKIADVAAQSMKDSAKADFTIELPNKTLSWDMKPWILGNSSFHAKTAFKIYHQKNLIILGVIAVALLIVIIILIAFAIVKRKNIRLKKYFAGTAMAIVLFLLGSGLYIKHTIDNPPKLTVQDRIMADNAKDSEGKPLLGTLKKIDATNLNSLDEVKSILSKKNITSEIVATSAIDDTGFLALVKNNKIYSFIVYDKKDDKIAEVLVPSQLTDDSMYMRTDILNFRATDSKDSKGKTIYPIVAFTMAIDPDNRSSADSKLGIWWHDRHSIRINMAFSVDENDKVVPKMIKSARGTVAGRFFPDALKDQVNVNLANSVITHLDSLKIDVIKRDIHIFEENGNPTNG